MLFTMYSNRIEKYVTEIRMPHLLQKFVYIMKSNIVDGYLKDSFKRFQISKVTLICGVEEVIY